MLEFISDKAGNLRHTGQGGYKEMARPKRFELLTFRSVV